LPSDWVRGPIGDAAAQACREKVGEREREKSDFGSRTEEKRRRIREERTGREMIGIRKTKTRKIRAAVPLHLKLPEG